MRRSPIRSDRGAWLASLVIAALCIPACTVTEPSETATAKPKADLDGLTPIVAGAPAREPQEPSAALPREKEPPQEEDSSASPEAAKPAAPEPGQPPQPREQEPQDDLPAGFNPRLAAAYRTSRGQSLVQRFGTRLQFLPGGKIRRFLHVPKGTAVELKGLIENQWLAELFKPGNEGGNLIEVEEKADLALQKSNVDAAKPNADQWTSRVGWKTSEIADWLIVTGDEAAQEELDRWLAVWWTGSDHIEVRVMVIARETSGILDLGSITQLASVDGDLFFRNLQSALPNSVSGGSFLDLHGVQDELELTSTLQMLQREGLTTVQSVPSIVLRDNTSAQISNTTRIPYQQTERVDPSGGTRFKVGWADTGVSMDVSAAITSNRIYLEFEVVLSTLNTALTNPDIPAPALAKTLLQGHATLVDGQSLWIGGLDSKTTREARRSVPIIGDIPLLSLLFSSSYDETIRTEVVFILTPTIRRSEGSLPDVSGPSGFDALFDSVEEEEGR